MGITNFIIPFYLQNVLMLTPAKSGIILASGAISMGIIGPFAGGMSDRKGMQKTITLGLFLMTLGLIGYGTLPSTVSQQKHLTYIITIIATQAMIGCGSTFFSAANTNSCLHSVKRNFQTSITGLLSVNLMAGSALGSTLGGEFFSLIGGVKHSKDSAAMVFPPHAFAYLFGFCTIWMVVLAIYGLKRPETIEIIKN
jgi:MFS family permease